MKSAVYTEPMLRIGALDFDNLIITSCHQMSVLRILSIHDIMHIYIMFVRC